MTSPVDAEQAVVLSGGGAYGAYELGVMEALFSGRWQGGQAPVQPTIFTGTSVGCFNAAFLVAESGARNSTGCLDAVRRLRDIWLDRIAAGRAGENGIFRLRGNPLGYVGQASPAESLARVGEDLAFVLRESFIRTPKFVLSDAPTLNRVFEQVDLSSFISTSPFHDLVHELMNPARLFDNDTRTLKVAVTNWDTGRVVVFANMSHEQRTGHERSTKASYDRYQLTSENARNVVLASAAIPGVFPPVDLDGESYVDGGLLMNTPLHPAISSNARTLHVIYLDPDFERIPRGEVRSTAYTLNRLVAVTFANIKEDIEYARLVRRLTATANSIARESPEVADPRVLEFLDDFAGMNELTIHRHYPSKSLGSVYGMLDFDRQRAIDLMELGFDDTVRHDCHRNGCLVD